MKVTQSRPTFCDSMDYRVHGILQARILEWVLPFLSPGALPNPGIESRSPPLQVDSLSAEPQGKSKNSGVGSLSVLQWIFPTLESNKGLLHCRRILYQLSYQGKRCLLEGNGLFPSDVLDNVDEFLQTDLGMHREGIFQ